MRDVVALAPVESAIGPRTEPDVPRAHVGQIGAAPPIVVQHFPGKRETALAELGKARDLDHRVGHLAARLVDHEPLDGPDLRAVRAAHQGSLDPVARDQPMRRPPGYWGRHEILRFMRPIHTNACVQKFVPARCRPCDRAPCVWITKRKSARCPGRAPANRELGCTFSLSRRRGVHIIGAGSWGISDDSASADGGAALDPDGGYARYRSRPNPGTSFGPRAHRGRAAVHLPR